MPAIARRSSNRDRPPRACDRASGNQGTTYHQTSSGTSSNLDSIPSRDHAARRLATFRQVRGSALRGAKRPAIRAGRTRRAGVLLKYAKITIVEPQRAAARSATILIHVAHVWVYGVSQLTKNVNSHVTDGEPLGRGQQLVVVARNGARRGAFVTSPAAVRPTEIDLAVFAVDVNNSADPVELVGRAGCRFQHLRGPAGRCRSSEQGPRLGQYFTHYRRQGGVLS